MSDKFEEENTNEGCLSGRRCPKCGQFGWFKIAFEGLADVTDEGSDDEGNHEWDEDSFCRCPECGFMGEARDFHEGTERWHCIKNGQPVPHVPPEEWTEDEKRLNALKVIALDPVLSEMVRKADSKAFEQIVRAIGDEEILRKFGISA